jgi:error-prone DNA polymerase
MPELQEAKRKRIAPLPTTEPTGPRYAELHCRTNFSFLEGASHPDELVNRAAELGYTALAVTDRNSLAGVVRAHVAARQSGLPLLIGAEITPNDAPPVVVWAVDRAGYGRLARLLTVGRRAAPKGQCSLGLADVAAHAEGLLAGVPLSRASTMEVCRYRDIFSDRCYALAELHRSADDRARLHGFLESARAARVPLAAANDVHYHVPARRPLQDVLTAVRHGCSVAELGERRFPNAQRHLRPRSDLAALFAAAPEALACTVEIAQRCRFSLDELRYEYPEELCPDGVTPLAHLTRLTWEGARNRYPGGVPEKVRRLVEHELALIAELRYEAYFLTVWDLVQYARARGILCQGRGSAANSAVCFCLGVTSVDPDRIDVLFERFISKERNEAPDIDIDFEHERREEVLQYIYAKYGRERAGMTAEVITYQARSAVRDVGKALGLSLDRIDVLAKAVDHRHDEERLRERFQDAGQTCDSFLARALVKLVGELVHFPRHLSQHVGGMVITRGPLCELVPIENATMPGRTVIEWDKDDLDALGVLKVDCLALGMLTAIRKAFDLIEQHYHRPLTLATVPAEDPAVYDMVCAADTIGVFQIESRAQMSMLPRLRPRCYYDLVIEVAIVRPGPIQGNMVHPYLRRRRGDEPVTYPDDRIRAVLEKTLGVPLFQEQAMRLAVVAAGFTPGEADQLRRAMGAWRRRGVMGPFRQRLIDGMQSNGYSTEFAERVFQQICGFGEYGFPESHAASFALLAYVSAWLKCYYPEVFTVALLNSQPMGFYAPAQLVADARAHGVCVRGTDVNFSTWDNTLGPADGQEGPRRAIRLGLRMIGGLPSRAGEAVVRSREAGPYVSFGDLVQRTGLRSSPLRKLAVADAFGSLGLTRREALWQILPDAAPLPLFDSVPAEEVAVDLPPMTPLGEVLSDYGSMGMTLREHPISFLRQAMNDDGVVPARRLGELPHGRRVTVAGLVLLRQRPSTAKGVTFVTLEDETGVVNLIIRQDIWERHRRAARSAVIMLAAGQLQREGGVIHVLVERVEDWSTRLADLDIHSRDFR